MYKAQFEEIFRLSQKSGLLLQLLSSFSNSRHSEQEHLYGLQNQGEAYMFPPLAFAQAQVLISQSIMSRKYSLDSSIVGVQRV